MTKERKIILIVGAIALIWGAVYRFYPDIRAAVSSDEEITLKYEKLIKYRGLVQERNRLEEKRAELIRTLERAESALLIGDTPALAAVDIQNALNEIAGRSSVEIKTVQVLTPEKADGKPYIGVPVQVSLISSVHQLKDILFRIETSPKLLNVADLRIRVIDAAKPDHVQATLTIRGYMKNPQKSDKESSS